MKRFRGSLIKNIVIMIYILMLGGCEDHNRSISSPPTGTHKKYYRIKQVDKDSIYRYSKIIVIDK